MFPRPKPKSGCLAALMVDSPPQPDLMLLIGVKAPLFIHFIADSTVFRVVGERCCLPNNSLENPEGNNNSDNDFMHTLRFGKMANFFLKCEIRRA
jgi:hypothetical protein